MSESESEQETEIFFKDPVHRSNSNSNNVDLATTVNNAESDDEIIEHAGQSRPDTETPRSESTIQKAVHDMIRMQSQMTEVLKNVSDVIVQALGPSQTQCRSSIQQNNNNMSDPDRNEEPLSPSFTNRRYRQVHSDRY